MSSFNRKAFLRILVIAFLTLAIGVIVNKLTDKLPDYNNAAYLGAAGLLIAILFVIFTTEEGKNLFNRNHQKAPTLTPEETQKNYDTIRQYLRQRYERRKDQKLAGDQLFNLRIKPTTEGTTPEKAETFITLQGKKTGEEIRQIFEKARRRLLVTGLPGTGKTSLLLNLALELLETDPESLAVLLNLATWRSDFPSFDDWLREILPAELGVTKRYAADILQAGKLTLLLDGLDEVAEEHRASCLKAIKTYGGEKHRDYVISTRKDEYNATDADAWVWAQIEVLPLTDKQLLSQLEMADRRDFPEAPDLKAALEHDPLLLRVAETPFYLNCLQLLFRGGNTLSELNFKGTTVEERQVEIIERFVAQALAQPSKYGSPKQVRHWLVFLASRMTQDNEIMFELTNIQPWWVKSKIPFSISTGILLGIVVYYSVKFQVGIFNGIVISPIWSSIFASFIFGASFWHSLIVKDKIIKIEIPVKKWNSQKINMKVVSESILTALIISSLISLVFIVYFYCLFDNSKGVQYKFSDEDIYWILFPSIGFFAIVFFGQILDEGLEIKKNFSFTKPYQRRIQYSSATGFAPL